jgi:phosphoribosyl 1,2-cyclic phosphodiesterase
MLIRCWGARGSIPVSGREYVTYGGDTTCLEIRNADDDIIIIDCGTGIRRLGNRLLQEKRHEYSMILTHAHWDHISGFPFFKPLYFSATRIAIHGCAFAQRSIKNILAKTMEAPFFPVDLSTVKATITFSDACGIPLTFGGLHVEPINLSHPNMGFGYKFSENGRTFIFLTDNELEHRHPKGRTYDEYLEFCHGADLLIHDAEYTDEEYQRTRAWGHSRYRAALKLALEAGVSRFGLFHHNQDRPDGAIDEILQDCRRIIAAESSSLTCFALTQDSEITL